MCCPAKTNLQAQTHKSKLIRWKRHLQGPYCLSRGQSRPRTRSLPAPLPTAQSHGRSARWTLPKALGCAWTVSRLHPADCRHPASHAPAPHTSSSSASIFIGHHAEQESAPYQWVTQHMLASQARLVALPQQRRKVCIAPSTLLTRDPHKAACSACMHRTSCMLTKARHCYLPARHAVLLLCAG